MNILLLLAPFSVLLGLGAVAAFVWTLRSGQYDDIRGAAERILMEDDGPVPARPGENPGQPPAAASPLPSEAPDEAREGGDKDGESADVFRREGHVWATQAN